MDNVSDLEADVLIKRCQLRLINLIWEQLLGNRRSSNCLHSQQSVFLSLLVMWYWASSQLPHTSHTNQPQPSRGCAEIWERNTEKSWEACLLHKQTREGLSNPWDSVCFAQGSELSFSHSQRLTFPQFCSFSSANAEGGSGNVRVVQRSEWDFALLEAADAPHGKWWQKQKVDE